VTKKARCERTERLLRGRLDHLPAAGPERLRRVALAREGTRNAVRLGLLTEARAAAIWARAA
jgi:hypothetical protein